MTPLGSQPPLPLPPPLRVRAEIGNERRIFTFAKPFRIGRTDDCDVCIKNEHVSRKHAGVSFENGSWIIRDLQSANGIFVEGERVQSVPLFTALKIRLGVQGPYVEFVVSPQSEPLGVHQPPVSNNSILPSLPPLTHSTPPQNQIQSTSHGSKNATHYFGNPEDQSVGEQTRMIRRAIVEVQTKQKRKYGGIIAGVALCALAAGGYAFYLHRDTQKSRAIAEDMFYGMKSIDVNIANVEKMVAQSGNAQGAEEVVRLRNQRKNLDDQYNHLLASLKIYDPKMSEQQKIVLRVARIFGECEVAMPPDFMNEIQNYINKWKGSGRYLRAVKLAKEKGYTATIAHEFLSQGLPPQFFYLGMQESDFDEFATGPPTHAGIAKGMWQFIPSTAEHYGLKMGPLVDMRRADPADDRHHWDRETKAAASYIKDLYGTDAQASGLLVMACYNWGERSVLPLVQTMPKNPRERNFWKLLSKYRDKIPDETYDYVFYIISAAVIGENPKLFGMDCDPPLAGL